MTHTILIAGGSNDPNLKHLLQAASESGVSVFPYLIEAEISPAFFWDMQKDNLQLMGRAINPSAVFIRRDVFHSDGVQSDRAQRHDRALAWHTALMGWVAVHPDVIILNRASISTCTNKARVLQLAAKFGLKVPNTYVTNNLDSTRALDTELIAKPVMGGGYCHKLSSIVESTDIRAGLTASPAIVQQQIEGDDIRIYRVRHQYFAFRIITSEVDYRQSSDHEIRVIEGIPESVISRLSLLMNELGLNWGAADFKECNQSAQWYFLEVNSNPMFSVFDRKAGGKICKSIFKFLLKPNQDQRKTK